MLCYKQFCGYEKQCRCSPNLSERIALHQRPQSRVGIPTNSSTMFAVISIIISLNFFKWGIYIESCIRIYISYGEHTNTIEKECQVFL